MRLAKAQIKNFRAIDDLAVEFAQHTVFIGPNGVGKSCVLKALAKFFAPSAIVSIEDFHERNTADPIEISLTFRDFSPAEQEAFSSKIFNHEMVVVRTFTSNAGPRENGKYFGESLRNPALQQIRAIDGGTPRRQAFNALVGSAGFEDLLPANNAPELVANMEAWEAAHADQCVKMRDDGQFFGFSNVGRGALGKYISFVLIPAVRDATSDSTDSKNSVINQLIELVVKSVVQKREDVRAWQEKAAAEYNELVSPENLGELAGLSDELTETLKVFYSDSGVDLSWQEPEELRVALPAAVVALMEQGYTGPVENKGHGLQRAFIFTLLQHLAKVLSQQAEEPINAAEEEPAVDQAAVAGVENVEPDAPHRVILAIEEPELYQHPVKQRHIARVLEQISGGHIPGVMSQTQVLVCSHSPHLVSAASFPNIRVARRIAIAEGAQPKCRVFQVSYAQAVQLLSSVYDEGEYDEDGLKARLHIIDEAVNEGFFCDLAVLVEGAGDRAALFAVAQSKGIDLASRGVAVIPVGGKANLDRPLAIFSLLRVPTYVVFDSDGNLPLPERKIQQNIAIQRLCGEAEPVEVRTVVTPKFASFESNLEKILEGELGQHYSDQRMLVAAKYGLKASAVTKNPVTCGEMVANCLALGGGCATLGAVVDNLV